MTTHSLNRAWGAEMLQLVRELRENAEAQTKHLERFEHSLEAAIRGRDDNIGRTPSEIFIMDYGDDHTLGGGIIHYVISEGECRITPMQRAEHYPSTKYANTTPEIDSVQVLHLDWHYWRGVQFIREEFPWAVSPSPNVVLKWAGRGRPDMVPVWELLKEGDGLWYHIDDGQKKFPIRNDSEHDSGEDQLMPYALSPPPHGERISRFGLHHKMDDIIMSLGELYSVPPDSRITLRFEKNQLRLAAQGGQLDLYLSQIRGLFDALEAVGGSFRVTDLDDLMNYSSYESTGSDSPTRGQVDSQGFLSGPALEKEHCELNILPISYPVHRILSVQAPLRKRPWHRIIHCHGFASVGASNIMLDGRNDADRSKLSDMWKILFRDTDDILVRDSSRLPWRILSETFSLHMLCNHDLDTFGAGAKRRLKPFHITWYRVVENAAPSTWRTGSLYPAGDKIGPETKIQQAAFTLGVYQQRQMSNILMPPDDDENRVADYHWTCILLTPLDFDKPILTASCNRWNPEATPEVVVLVLIAYALEMAADSWQEIESRIREIMGVEYNAVLDPDKHDSLLFDDAYFSRSRLLFWASDILNLFLLDLKHSIEQWQSWWEAWESTLRKSHFSFGLQMEKRMEQEEGLSTDCLRKLDPARLNVEGQVRRLMRQHYIFKELLNDTERLRQSLFTASSVIESRAASELGRNVKLLTYVSIFYLPLGVCAGMFSINESYSFSSFIISSVLVAAGTYVLVANIERIVRAFWRGYRAFQQSILDAMARDLRWVDTSRRFRKFPPEREDFPSSKWLVVWYAIVRGWRALVSKWPNKDRLPQPVLREHTNAMDSGDRTTGGGIV